MHHVQRHGLLTCAGRVRRVGWIRDIPTEDSEMAEPAGAQAVAVPQASATAPTDEPVRVLPPQDHVAAPHAPVSVRVLPPVGDSDAGELSRRAPLSIPSRSTMRGSLTHSHLIRSYERLRTETSAAAHGRREGGRVVHKPARFREHPSS